MEDWISIENAIYIFAAGVSCCLALAIIWHIGRTPKPVAVKMVTPTLEDAHAIRETT